MTTRCPFSDPQDPVSRVSNIRGQGPSSGTVASTRLPTRPPGLRRLDISGQPGNVPRSATGLLRLRA
ncbi:hypothetical protein CWE27_06345 [Streptomyces sp. EAG2]|nr:hypothetical protein CWE27_06345 [Streptomyces sp. EAG2]